MKIPTDQDWHSEAWDLDIPYAYRHFSNKTIEEGIALFVKDSMVYQEDIMFMPKNCFRYYIHSYINYLLSEKSKGDSDGASCFFGLFEVRKQDFTEESIVKERTINLMKHMRSRQHWYEADIDIYGDFSSKADEIIETLENA